MKHLKWILCIVPLLAIAGICAAKIHKEVKQSHMNACINNLRLIDSCKQQWALEQRKGATDTLTVAEFWDEYWPERPKPMNELEMPCCPDDPAQRFTTSYRLGTIGEPPTCLIDPKNHALPQQAAEKRKK